jgi:hypothetical protein
MDFQFCESLPSAPAKPSFRPPMEHHRVYRTLFIEVFGSSMGSISSSDVVVIPTKTSNAILMKVVFAGNRFVAFVVSFYVFERPKSSIGRPTYTLASLTTPNRNEMQTSLSTPEASGPQISPGCSVACALEIRRPAAWGEFSRRSFRSEHQGNQRLPSNCPPPCVRPEG